MSPVGVKRTDGIVPARRPGARVQRKHARIRPGGCEKERERERAGSKHKHTYGLIGVRLPGRRRDVMAMTESDRGHSRRSAEPSQ